MMAQEVVSYKYEPRHNWFLPASTNMIFKKRRIWTFHVHSDYGAVWYIDDPNRTVLEDIQVRFTEEEALMYLLTGKVTWAGENFEEQDGT